MNAVPTHCIDWLRQSKQASTPARNGWAPPPDLTASRISLAASSQRQPAPPPAAAGRSPPRPCRKTGEAAHRYADEGADEGVCGCSVCAGKGRHREQL